MYGNVLQIMPTQPGWEAVFAADKNQKAKMTYFTTPLNCWAVVEFKAADSKASSTLVVGMVSVEDSHVLDFVDVVGDFLGYNYPGCQINWHVKAATFRNETRHSLSRGQI
jgi:hypothetical protein